MDKQTQTKNNNNLIIWKTSGGCRAKRSEISDSWVPVNHIWDTFNLVAFIVMLGSFGTLVIILKNKFFKAPVLLHLGRILFQPHFFTTVRILLTIHIKFVWGNFEI